MVIPMNFTFYSRFMKELAARGADGCAEYARSLGFSSAEVLQCSLDGAQIAKTGDAEALRRCFAGHSLSFACYSVGVNLFRSPAEEERNLMRHAELAAALGSPFLHHTLCTWLSLPENAPSYDTVISSVTASAARVAAYAEKLGIRCIYEDQGCYVNGVERFGTFYREVKRLCPSVGVCGDLGNSLFVGTAPKDFISAFAGDIVHVHVKDYKKLALSADAPVPDGLLGHRLPGDLFLAGVPAGSGESDIPACMEILKNAGYRGAFAFEFDYTHDFPKDVADAEILLEKLWN